MTTRHMIEEIVNQIKGLRRARFPFRTSTPSSGTSPSANPARPFQGAGRQAAERSRVLVHDRQLLYTSLPDTWGSSSGSSYSRSTSGTMNITAYSSAASPVTAGLLQFRSAFNAIFMPVVKNRRDPLYIGFFHTGAYQRRFPDTAGSSTACSLPRNICSSTRTGRDTLRPVSSRRSSPRNPC